MEVRSEQSFSLGMQKTPVATQPSISGMRLTVTPDGTAVYKPIIATTTTNTVSSTVAPSFHGGMAASGGVDGDRSPAAPMMTLHGLNVGAGEPMKKKRGRPRKYGPDGTMALALSTVSPTSAAGSGGFSPSSAGQGNTAVSVSGDPMKKAIGRPRGSGKKQQMLALGNLSVLYFRSCGWGSLSPIDLLWSGASGEDMMRRGAREVGRGDVSSKIMSFSHHGPRAICILSANGAISNVTLRQTAISGGTVTYEGRFEILSLSGSFLLSENGGQRSRTGGLSVSLAGPDGRVLGGSVAGLLTAASPVQVIVGSFMADGKKEPKRIHPFDGVAPLGKHASGNMMTGGSSPPSRGTLSESSGGPASPPHQATCSNIIQQGMSGISWK
ncbi:hypothetical protein AXF42_Ash017279 [Apostasia shenzhenica]|uniref:AT-hook motif nuclear-localized protein n=1 Tax=Apostasia shenzhenica TaxID=1088818 RepID=A0A2H9ZVN2_9ASPA|nr:hypothetical protein AXF42_Ash017279 [Apostasia shenzhenica]